ncbi:hypothetical protein DIPPA_12739 [Diplonema papillatum]|nr:hypothetical protein DIPPA_12739 [Diplonema papillatum]
MLRASLAERPKRKLTRKSLSGSRKSQGSPLVDDPEEREKEVEAVLQKVLNGGVTGSPPLRTPCTTTCPPAGPPHNDSFASRATASCTEDNAGSGASSLNSSVSFIEKPGPSMQDRVAGLQHLVRMLKKELKYLHRSNRAATGGGSAKKALERHPVHRLLQGMRVVVDQVEGEFLSKVNPAEYEIPPELLGNFIMSSHFAASPARGDGPYGQQDEEAEKARSKHFRHSKTPFSKVLRLPTAAVSSKANVLRRYFTGGGRAIGSGPAKKLAAKPPARGDVSGGDRSLTGVDWRALILSLCGSSPAQHGAGSNPLRAKRKPAAARPVARVPSKGAYPSSQVSLTKKQLSAAPPKKAGRPAASASLHHETSPHKRLHAARGNGAVSDAPSSVKTADDSGGGGCEDGEGREQGACGRPRNGSPLFEAGRERGSFGSDTLSQDETIARIVGNIDVAATGDEKHSVGKALKEFRRLVEKHAAPVPPPKRPAGAPSPDADDELRRNQEQSSHTWNPNLDDEIGAAAAGFQEALTEHLVAVWKLCVPEDSHEALLRDVSFTVSKHVGDVVDRIWKERFRANDRLVQDKIKSTWLAATADGSLQESPYESASHQLVRLTTEEVLVKKLDALVASLGTVHDLVADRIRSKRGEGAGDGKADAVEVGADAIFPIFIHCLLRSNPANAWSVSELLAVACPDMKGEAGWAQATFNAALLFILSSPLDVLITYFDTPDELPGIF